MLIRAVQTSLQTSGTRIVSNILKDVSKSLQTAQALLKCNLHIVKFDSDKWILRYKCLKTAFQKKNFEAVGANETLQEFEADASCLVRLSFRGFKNEILGTTIHR